MDNRSESSMERKCRQDCSLIGLMVYVLSRANGGLGVAALQTVALKNTGGSASRTQAAIQTYSMMDIIRANRANIGIYNTTIYTEGDGTGADGTMTGWLAGLPATVAPAAQGRVVCLADTIACTQGGNGGGQRPTGATTTPPPTTQPPHPT